MDVVATVEASVLVILVKVNAKATPVFESCVFGLG